MQGSKVKGPEGGACNETVGTNPQQREAHPDHSANEEKEKTKTEPLPLLWFDSSDWPGLNEQAGLRREADKLGLDFQEAVTCSRDDGATLPFSAFDPCI